MLGLPGGRMFTIAGKSSTGKTTLAIGMSHHIIKNFEESSIIHVDIEQATTNSRVMSVTDVTREDIESNRYYLTNDIVYIEDLMDLVFKIVDNKEAHKKDLLINTGLLDEFGSEIINYAPTVIIVDSIASLESKDVYNTEFGATDAMQLARRIKSFYKKMMPICSRYNIFIININHLFKKIGMNPFQKEQAQTNYFDIDEYSPGGDGPIIYAHTMLKLIASDKRKKEDDGYDGFICKCKLLKSRTNKSGKIFIMAYDQERGFCPFLTLYEFLKMNGYIEGRNPYQHFKGSDLKFDSRKLVGMIGTPEGDAIYNEGLISGKLLFESMLSTTTSMSDVMRDIDEEE